MSRRIADLENQALQQESKVGAAMEMGMDAVLRTKETRAMAASAMRQTSKVCIVLEGDAMPPRTKKLESRVKEAAIALIKRHLDVRVEPDEIGAAHYRQPDDNKSIILKFWYVGDGTAYDEILKRSRKVQPRGFYAKLMEVGHLVRFQLGL